MRDRRAQAHAKRLRRSMTKAETVLWTALKGRALDGWRFRRQHPVGPYVADFACVEAKLVVEVDGATHGERHEIEHDRERSAFLARQGFRVLRVGNLDVYENLDGVVRLIAASLAPLRPSASIRSAAQAPRTRGETSAETFEMSSPVHGGGVGEADGGGVMNTHPANGRIPQ